MRWFRRRKHAVERNDVSPRVTFPELLVWSGVILFLFLTLAPIFVPDAVPAFFGVREVGSPGTSGYIPPKTLWDWFGLVAIPFAIVVVGYVLNRADRNHEQRLQEQRLQETRKIEAQRIAEGWSVEERRLQEAREIETQRTEEARAIEQERAQDIVVSDYLDQMTDLLLSHSLRDSAEEDEVRSVARARTLTALRRVYGVRKGTIVQFLYEARLVGYLNDDLEQVDAVVQLNEANLAGADLARANLAGADLAWTDLTGANLARADLNGAILNGASLEMARFTRADLGLAKLNGAKLNGADLTGANLELAYLTGAKFTEANLTGADLTGTKFTSCEDITPDQLLQADSLHGAILPDYINPADLGDLWSPPKPKNTPEPQP